MFPSIKENSFKLFVNNFSSKLKPILQELSNVTRIVWVQQAPVLNNINSKSPNVFIAKYHHYNAAMRNILEYFIKFIINST